MAGRIVRGDIHMRRFPPPDKERPVLLLTRDSVLAYLATVAVAPITSRIRGVSAEVFLDVEDGMKGPCVVNLHNITIVPQDQLGPRLARLSDERMKEVCAALRFSLGCD